MGCSCDWERTRFTLDEICSRAVRRTFFHLFQAGKIFRGKRLVNWDTHLRTAVADDEIDTEDVAGPSLDDQVSRRRLATARRCTSPRPGPRRCSAIRRVAVHPDDPRYKHLIGKTVDLPSRAARSRSSPTAILVDPKFGTGCVKVTPAHDPNDYQAGLRQQACR